jgi:regulatory protein
LLAESEKLKVLDRMQRYCAYQERCHKEVRGKLLDIEVYGDDLEDIIMSLVQDNYLNEERFARSFARGKFRIKKWGKMRISAELKRREISDYCQRKAMTEIDQIEYLDTARQLGEKLLREYAGQPEYIKKQKVIRRMATRGFEFELIHSVLNELMR